MVNKCGPPMPILHARNRPVGLIQIYGGWMSGGECHTLWSESSIGLVCGVEYTHERRSPLTYNRIERVRYAYRVQTIQRPRDCAVRHTHTHPCDRPCVSTTVCYNLVCSVWTWLSMQRGCATVVCLSVFMSARLWRCAFWLKRRTLQQKYRKKWTASFSAGTRFYNAP